MSGTVSETMVRETNGAPFWTVQVVEEMLDRLSRPRRLVLPCSDFEAIRRLLPPSGTHADAIGWYIPWTLTCACTVEIRPGSNLAHVSHALRPDVIDLTGAT